MNKNVSELRDKIYDLEMSYEEISMLIDIIKEFGEYSSEMTNGAEKMYFLANVLSEKSLKYKKLLAEFIPGFQELFKD